MRLLVYLALAIAVVLLSPAALAAPDWWNEFDCTNRREIRLPDQDINAYKVVQVETQNLTGLHFVVDHNLDHSGDDNLDSIVDVGSDGNMFFQLPYPISSGQSEADRYQTYYDYYNCSGGAANDSNVARHDICSAESTSDPCSLSVATRSTDQAKFGAASMSGDNLVEQLTSIPGLGGRFDFNYTGWFYSHDATQSTYMTLTASGGTQVCLGGMLADQFYYKDGSSHYVGTADDNTWYQVAIQYVDGNSATGACHYTWYDEDGVALEAANGNVKNGSGTIVGLELYFNSGASSTTYWDNFYYGSPIIVTGFGTEETENIVRPDLNIWRVDGYDVVEDQFPQFTSVVDGNLTLDFNVFNPDNNRMTVDINYSTSNAQGSGTVIVDNLSLVSDVCADQDWDDSPSSCSWDWNIVSILDGNYFILMELTDINSSTTSFDATPNSFHIPSPVWNLFVLDENTGVPLVSTTISGIGRTFSTDSLGFVQIGLASQSGVKVFSISEDSNYPVRYFSIDVNSATVLDLNAYMLKQESGRATHFKFFDTDGTTVLTNTLVRMIRDGNFSSIRYTNASGQTSFFMDMDGNYVFDVVKSGTEVTRYYPVTLNVRLPKDEGSITTAITPYDLTVSGLNDTSYTGYSVDVNYRVYSNTVNFFVFDVNAGLDYYARRYYYNTTGNPQTDILQPYLVKVVDSLDVAVFTKNAADLAVEPNIFIRSFKTIAGEGRIQIQAVQTDDAGVTSMSFIDGDEYELEFYDQNNSHLFNKTIRPEFTSLYIYVDTGEFDLPDVNVESIAVSGLPTTGHIVYNDSGYDFNVTIAVTNGTIDTSWFTVKNDVADKNLTFNTTCGEGCNYNVARTDLDLNNTITVKVFVKTESGMIYEQEFFYVPVDEDADNLLVTLRSAEFRQQWGCSTDTNDPCFLLLMVSVFMILAIIATAHEIGATRDTNSLSILAIIGMGLFVYLTWIPVSFFILACLGAFGGFIVSRRD